MSIKTNELQQLQSILGTDSLLADTAAAGTGRLSLARAAEFFGAELIKPGNPVGAALSNKAALSVQQTVEAASVPSRTVEVAAAELPAYIASLPRLLTENLHIKVSGTLTGTVTIKGFYGSGNILINGINDCTISGYIEVIRCRVPVEIMGLTIQYPQTTSKDIAAFIAYRGQGDAYIHDCTLVQTGGDVGGVAVLGAYGSRVRAYNINISGFNTVALSTTESIILVEAGSGQLHDNVVGPYTYGGIILIGAGTPDFLGGTSIVKGGGLIVKADGTLL